jgi:predicted AAA+ superfamily ATPase
MFAFLRSREYWDRIIGSRSTRIKKTHNSIAEIAERVAIRSQICESVYVNPEFNSRFTRVLTNPKENRTMNQVQQDILITRDLQTVVTESMRKYPIVTITGARQTGKTTLAKMAAPHLPYVNLESPKERAFAEQDPQAFLKRYSEGAIIDEVQRVPEIASWLQVHVDAKGKNGLFILTGSQNFSLMHALSQSLAGRTAVLHLLPFSLKEFSSAHPFISSDDLMFNGFYPRIIQQRISPIRGYGDYVETYLERDVRQIIEVRHLSTFRRFLTLCAGRVGQLLNKANLASDLGVDEKTIEAWLSALEASWIIFRLSPWSQSQTKRLIKSPKLYFYDVGLASFLLGIEHPSHISSHPLRGNLFENMVIAEFLKERYHTGRRSNLFFYRDSASVEVDVVLEKVDSHDLVEIKSSQTWTPALFASLKKVRHTLGNPVKHSWLIYDGSEDVLLDNDQLRLVPLELLTKYISHIVGAHGQANL